MKKKSKSSLWADVSILVVAVLAISAFARGNLQFWLYVVAFAAWGVWAFFRHLLPLLSHVSAQHEARHLQKSFKKRIAVKKAMVDVNIDDPLTIVLLRHVNHRISAYLQSAYPDATWEWCCDDPERIVSKGGTGRICLHNVADYNFAEISLDQNARIGCQLLKIVPFSSDDPAPGTGKPKPVPKPREIDPQVWYEKKGKLVLTNLIADLASRGHSSLTIQEDGSICIQQSGKEVKRAAFETIPERTYWPRLVKVFEREGITSSITAQGIVLSW